MENLVVLVTGFGPFMSNEINSSSEAVKELKQIGLGIKNSTLITKEINVEYDYVDETIPNLLNDYNPKLIVHVGLSCEAHCLTLEQFANCSGYYILDNKGKCPDDNNCKSVESSDEIFKSIIDMEEIMGSPILKSKNITTKVSCNAGNFLCDYIYCTTMALQKSQNKPLSCAFIHVPPLNEPFTSKELAYQLRKVIQAILSQLKDKKVI